MEATDLGGESHVNVDSLAMQQLIAGHQSRHLKLWGEGVAVVDQSAQNVLPQVVLQLLQHSLDAAPHGCSCFSTLYRCLALSAQFSPSYRGHLKGVPQCVLDYKRSDICVMSVVTLVC